MFQALDIHQWIKQTYPCGPYILMEEVSQLATNSIHGQIIYHVRERFIGSEEMNNLNIHKPTKVGNHDWMELEF